MRPEARAAVIAWRGIRAAVMASPIPPEQRITAAYYLLVTGCDVRGAQAAAAIGCTKQNISKALRKVEDRRADPQFDAALARLEAQLFGEAS